MCSRHCQYSMNRKRPPPLHAQQLTCRYSRMRHSSGCMGRACQCLGPFIWRSCLKVVNQSEHRPLLLRQQLATQQLLRPLLLHGGLARMQAALAPGSSGQPPGPYPRTCTMPACHHAAASRPARGNSVGQAGARGSARSFQEADDVTADLPGHERIPGLGGIIAAVHPGQVARERHPGRLGVRGHHAARAWGAAMAPACRPAACASDGGFRVVAGVLWGVRGGGGA